MVGETPMTSTTFWSAFYILAAVGVVLGLVSFVANQVRTTFFPPPVQGTVRHTESFRFVRGSAFSFKNRAHIVLTDKELVISICRLFYKYFPRHTSIFTIPLSGITEITKVQDAPFNVRIDVAS
jgi:hypothetical protein